jgi:hypothetical protein
LLFTSRACTVITCVLVPSAAIVAVSLLPFIVLRGAGRRPIFWGRYRTNVATRPASQWLVDRPQASRRPSYTH